MKTNMKKMWLILMLLTLSVKIFAQTIQEIKQEILEQEILERIGQLEDFLYIMTEDDTDLASRQKYGKAALKLFAGGGGEYTLNGVVHSAPTIECAFINSMGKENSFLRPAKSYIERLIAIAEAGRRVRIDIKSATIYLLATSTLEWVGGSLYKASIWICRYDPNDKTISYYDLVPKYIITRLNIDEPMPEEIILLDEVKVSEQRW